MATSSQVLEMLLPSGGWIITEDDFDTIVWVDDRPRCTKQEFLDGFAQFDALKLQDTQAKAEAKSALLDRLGITEEEAALLLG